MSARALPRARQRGAVLFIALIVLGESFAPLAWLGIAVSVGGTLYLSLAGRVTSLREVHSTAG